MSQESPLYTFMSNVEEQSVHGGAIKGTSQNGNINGNGSEGLGHPGLLGDTV